MRSAARSIDSTARDGNIDLCRLGMIMISNKCKLGARGEQEGKQKWPPRPIQPHDGLVKSPNALRTRDIE